MHVKGIMYKQTIMYFVNPRMTSGVTKGNNDHHHEQQQEAAPVGLASPGWCQRWYVRVLYHLCE